MQVNRGAQDWRRLRRAVIINTSAFDLSPLFAKGKFDEHFKTGGLWRTRHHDLQPLPYAERQGG